MVAEGALLWEPTAEVIARARLTRYLESVGHTTYAQAWQWSVDDPGGFWTSVWRYFDVVGDLGDGPVITGTMPGAEWFSGTSLNYAENALRRADGTALVFVCEDGTRRVLSMAELRSEVARVRAGLVRLGVRRGDRVAGYLGNVPEALIAFLATASLGAIWSSGSPDFGVPSIVDRFKQIEPKVLIAVDGYRYNGRWFDRTQAVQEIAAELPTLVATVRLGAEWDELRSEEGPLEFERVPFGHPLWILYSSGTTGLPKPIVHGHGGIVLEHLKSLSFHQDLGEGDVFFWYTTTGWMMWNYLIGALLVGAVPVLYDGAPVDLWQVAADEGVTYMGVGAPYILASMKLGKHPAGLALKGLGSTGSPLPPEGFAWVAEALPGVPVGSFSGGTDVCTGFVGWTPLHPVRAGVISCLSLGAAIGSFDTSGKPVVGEVGELVLTGPMPSMPVMFWNDSGGDRYRDSYFDVYPGVWRHGDWIKINPDGSCVIYGRSDSTLNRGGVRMGTSEFYRVVERFDAIADSLVIDTGQLGQEGRLLLYVTMAEGQELTDELAGSLRKALREELSPRHVPNEIHAVPGIPRTLSGKKLEVPVRKILLGTPVEEAANLDAMANPEVLRHFTP
ncbi:acetoacetate--CoA ligase [Nonomuraea sediminis]|uniref:acetoacetate--CoA ligase n=1 Tax=Nonomuraea sediminis TaxID=2835864 RepID=UPI001BDC97EC|nr:acetoacetate--CoA ligase [Nonomuraea sediminis]